MIYLTQWLLVKKGFKPSTYQRGESQEILDLSASTCLDGTGLAFTMTLDLFA
jgi:hypothetical protein